MGRAPRRASGRALPFKSSAGLPASGLSRSIAHAKYKRAVALTLLSIPVNTETTEWEHLVLSEKIRLHAHQSALKAILMIPNARLLSTIVLTSVLHHGIAQTPELLEHWWQCAYPTSPGKILAAVVDTTINTLYAGGTMAVNGTSERLTPPVPTTFGVVVEADGLGWPLLEHDSPDGYVNAVLSDGSGGWFIGGNFTSVGGVPRQKLARLNGDGTLNTGWGPTAGVQGYIQDMVIHNGALYVAGSFTAAGGAPVANNLAAFDLISGELLPWGLGSNYGTNGIVWALTVANNMIIAGGDFLTAGGSSHQRIAAIDPTTAQVLPWTTSFGGAVRALASADGKVYVGGSFTTVNGSTGRGRVAALSANDGSLTAWNPSANNNVYSIAVSGDTVYVGGAFTTISGVPRARFAALDRLTDTNNALGAGYANFTDFACAVQHIEVSGGFVYVGGSCSQLVSLTGVGVYRHGSVLLDRTTGEILPWNPSFSASAMAVNGSTVYLADGGATGVRHYRSKVFAMDLATGRPTDWRSHSGLQGTLPNTHSIDGTVRAMALKGDTIFIAGEFTEVDGMPRNHVAALHKLTGALLEWQVNANNTVTTMEIVGNTLYVGGDFTVVNGIERHRLAAVNISTMAVLGSWQADVEGVLPQVHVMHANNDNLYIGGRFSTVGSESRVGIAVLDRTTGAVLPFNVTGVDVSNAVTAIQTTGDTIYFSGVFDAIGGIPRLGLVAVLESSTSVIPNWVCDESFDVNSSNATDLLVKGGALYVANSGTLNGQPVGRLGIVGTHTGAVLTNWTPDFDGEFDRTDVYRVLRTGDLLIALGGFETVGGMDRARIAAWSGMNEYEASLDIGTLVSPSPVAESRTFLYPNPTAGSFTYEVQQHAQPHDLSVLDATGRILVTRSIANTAGPVTVDLSGHEGGLYFLQVHFADGTQAIERIVKD